MAIIKAEGLVIRTMKFRETSKLVTLFTRESGIMTLNAKGSRTLKSRFGAALEPLTVAKIVYYHRDTREIQLLSQAEISERFPNLQSNMGHWGYASACCELIRKTQISTEPAPQLYPIALDTLRAMNVARDPRRSFWGFQMKLLSVQGIAPSLRRCLKCQSPVAAAAPPDEPTAVFFHISEGGFYCDNCSAHEGVLRLHDETLRLLAVLQTQPAAKLLQYRLSAAAMRETEQFFRTYYSYHLPEIGQLESLKFVRELGKK